MNFQPKRRQQIEYFKIRKQQIEYFNIGVSAMNNYSAINVLAASPLLDVYMYTYIYIYIRLSANHVGPMIFHVGPSLFQGYMQNQTETNRFEGSPQRKTHAFAKGMHDAWLLHFFGAQMLSPTGHAPLPQTDRIFQNKGFCYEQLLCDKCPSC